MTEQLIQSQLVEIRGTETDIKYFLDLMELKAHYWNVTIHVHSTSVPACNGTVDAAVPKKSRKEQGA